MPPKSQSNETSGITIMSVESIKAPVNPKIEHYKQALETSMDDFIGVQGPLQLSAMRQAFMAGAQFQLNYMQKELKS